MSAAERPSAKTVPRCGRPDRRTALGSGLAAGLAALAGCQAMQRFRPPAAAPPQVLPAGASLDQLLQSVNGRTASIRQIKTNVRVAAAGLPGLRGELLVERPSRLRLQAGLMGMNDAGIDLGSNDDAFWIWQKSDLPGQPQTFYFARHLEYQHSGFREAFQLQPLWLIDALGLVEFPPDDQHEGPFPRNDGRVEIRSRPSGPGPTTTRRAMLDPRTLEIHQQSFYDPQGRLIAWLDSIRHEPVPDTSVRLPRRIEIHVLGQGAELMRLTVDAGQYSVNSIFGDPDLLWTMPRPEGVRWVDLSRGTIVQPVVESARREGEPSGHPSGFRRAAPMVR